MANRLSHLPFFFLKDHTIERNTELTLMTLKRQQQQHHCHQDDSAVVVVVAVFVVDRRTSTNEWDTNVIC